MPMNSIPADSKAYLRDWSTLILADSNKPSQASILRTVDKPTPALVARSDPDQFNNAFAARTCIPVIIMVLFVLYLNQLDSLKGDISYEL
jgi:hypothetical protein